MASNTNDHSKQKFVQSFADICQLTSLLTCHMCEKILEDPLSLECTHRFCRDCLLKELSIINSQYSICVICKQSYTIEQLITQTNLLKFLSLFHKMMLEFYDLFKDNNDNIDCTMDDSNDKQSRQIAELFEFIFERKSLSDLQTDVLKHFVSNEKSTGVGENQISELERLEINDLDNYLNFV